MQVLVLHEESSADHGHALAKHLAGLGAQVSCQTYGAAAATATAAPLAHVFALQARQAPAGSTHEAAIAAQFERHLTAAKMARNNDSGAYATLTFIAFDGGLLGLGEDTPHYSVGATAGFSRCVFIESQSFDPDCRPRGRVISLPADCDMPRMADVVAREVARAEDYHEVGFTSDGRRWEPREVLAEPRSYPEITTFDSRDVLMVTGGGKGITPACAFALAQRANIKNVALLGRSAAPAGDGDDELSRNIRKFNDHGMRCKYYVCDITDPASIEATLAAIRRDLGPVGA
ncbi:MAG TPA: KR domain-containing protein, partial [Myxococcota bacterium]|nr:KR domain-containing protein [Myxococcota bacterium]